jgi:hypothetical protein
MGAPEWLALCSDVILLVTMAVFAYQARQMAKQSRDVANSTRASVYQGIADQMLALDQLFIARPELRPYIYDGVALPPDPVERTRVLALAETFVDLFDNFVIQSASIPDDLFEPWRNYAVSLMGTSPAMQFFWNQNRDWYSEVLQRVLDGHDVTRAEDMIVREEMAHVWEGGTTQSD